MVFCCAARIVRAGADARAAVHHLADRTLCWPEMRTSISGSGDPESVVRLAWRWPQARVRQLISSFIRRQVKAKARPIAHRPLDPLGA